MQIEVQDQSQSSNPGDHPAHPLHSTPAALFSACHKEKTQVQGTSRFVPNNSVTALYLVS